MKRSAWILLPLVIAVIAVWIFRKPSETPPSGNAPEEVIFDEGTAEIAAPPSNPNRTPNSPLATLLHHPDQSPQKDLEIVYTLLVQTRLYVKDLATRPIGTNAEFTAVLTGDNRLQLAAIPPNHPAINESGELTDRWGTPLFFHPVSSSETTLRSAGPDRQLFTQDDGVYPEK